MGRFWLSVGKVLGSLLLFGGGALFFGLTIVLIISNTPGWSVLLLSAVMVIFGLVPASLGGWLLYASEQARRQAIRESFFQLLHRNQGRVALLEFAATAKLEPAKARLYLDKWASECDANFDVSEGGDIYYIFTSEPLSLPYENRWQFLTKLLQKG